jgi:hypothetical protein
VPLVEQELLTLPEHLSSAPVFSGVRVTRSLCVMFCRLLLVLFCHCVVSYLRFTDSDYPVGILDLRILITPLCLLHYGTRRVNLVTNPVIGHEMRKGPGSVYDKCNISVVICAYDKCNISVVICAIARGKQFPVGILDLRILITSLVS